MSVKPCKLCNSSTNSNDDPRLNLQWCQSDEEDANVPQVEPEKDLKFGDEEDVNVPQVEPEKDLKSGDAEDANVPQVETEKDLKFRDGNFGAFGGEKCWILFKGDAAPVPLDSLTMEQEFKLENGRPFQYVPPPSQVPVEAKDDNDNGMGSSDDVCPGASMERAKRKEVGVVEADRLMKKRTLLLGETSTDDEDNVFWEKHRPFWPQNNVKPASKKAKGPAKRSKDTPSTGPIKKLPSKMVKETSSTSPTEKLPDANMVGDGSSHSPSEKLPDVNTCEDGRASGHADELPSSMVEETSSTSPTEKLPDANMVGDGSSHSPSEKLPDVNTFEDGRASGHADELPSSMVEETSSTSPTEKLPSEKLPDVKTVEDGQASGHADGLPDVHMDASNSNPNEQKLPDDNGNGDGVEEDLQDPGTEKVKKAAKRQDYRANKAKQGFEMLRKTSIQDLKIAKDFAQSSLVSTSSL